MLKDRNSVYLFSEKTKGKRRILIFSCRWCHVTQVKIPIDIEKMLLVLVGIPLTWSEWLWPSCYTYLSRCKGVKTTNQALQSFPSHAWDPMTHDPCMHHPAVLAIIMHVCISWLDAVAPHLRMCMSGAFQGPVDWAKAQPGPGWLS